MKSQCILFCILMYVWSLKYRIEATQLNRTKKVITNSLRNGSNINIDFSTLNIEALNEFELVIPEECKELGICEHIPNYPQEDVSKIIDRLATRNIYLQADVNPGEDINDDNDNNNENENISTGLCSEIKTLFQPLAARDVHNNWYLVLNSENSPQNFRGIRCRAKSEQCSGEITFPLSMHGVCIQKYIARKAYVYDSPTKTAKNILIQIPSCCACNVVRT